MDEESRTIWCGNLSNKVTEDILYELFLQGGPVQRVSIPKDRDGKQRTFGFVTYKHYKSVPYALDLFDGTSLYSRTLSIKTRNNTDFQQAEKQSPEPPRDLNQILQMGRQMIIGNFLPNMRIDTFDANPLPGSIVYPSQIDVHSFNDDRRPNRRHPYHRDYNSRTERDNHDHGRDHRSHKHKNDSNRSHDYGRSNNYRNNRWKHH